MMDFSPLPWGEGGESSEPGEGFLPTEPRNFGIRDKGTTTGPDLLRTYRATAREPVHFPPE
jgi:hypothetical protein